MLFVTVGVNYSALNNIFFNIISFKKKNKNPAVAGCHPDRRSPIQHLKAELLFWDFPAFSISGGGPPFARCCRNIMKSWFLF